MEEVNVVDYDPNWANEFEKEKIKLLNALSGLQVVIEHIGSTSVPGLGSKPTIDIMAGISELDLIDETYKARLLEIGYEYVEKPDFPERLFFRRGQWRAGTHHLHFYTIHGKHWRNQLLFRTVLKQHPEIRNDYYRLKKSLEERFKHDRVAYTEGKSDFITRVISRANEEQGTGDYIS